MTSIVYKDGVIAGDTGHFRGDTLVGHAPKVFRNSKDDLAGCAGDASFIQIFIRWFLGGEVGPPPSSLAVGEDKQHNEALLVRDGGQILYLMHQELIPFDDLFFSIGGGSDVAYGAMFAGSDAATAVRAAISRSVWVAGDIITLNHEGEQKHIKLMGDRYR